MRIEPELKFLFLFYIEINLELESYLEYLLIFTRFMFYEQGREMTGTELSSDSLNQEVLDEFSDSFVRWVNQGETICF